MKKIEKTKKNIGVSALDTETRKKLFNNFIDAGGEVIKDKEERGLSEFDRELQRKYRERLEKTKKQNKIFQNDLKTPKKISDKSRIELKNTSTQISDIKNISRFRLFFQQFYIRLKLFFMNVTDFSGHYLTVKFLKNFDEEYKTSLLSSQMTYINLFKQNMRTGQKITDSMDKMHPIYFELIELLSNIFDRTAINEILEHYYNFPDVPQEAKELREQLTRFFRKIYPLNGYRELILSAMEKALTLQTRIEKSKINLYSANKKKLKNDMYIIFSQFYPRLFYLMCLYEGRIFQSNMDIEDSIQIPAENMPGRRKRIVQKTIEVKPSEKTDDGDTEDNENKSKENIPENIKSGFMLMDKIINGRNDEFHTKYSIFKNINKKDKVYITNTLFEDFDREFSFILTTNKIKYNTLSKSSDNTDFKSKFIGIYNEIPKCKSRLIDYVKTLSAFEKLKKEKPISSTQFIEYSNRLTALEKERNQTGQDARMFIKAYLERMAKELNILLDDMDKSRSIVFNPDDILVFETNIEGDKILNGKSVHEAINYTYNYLMAFIYRLSLDGDLSGGLDFRDGEDLLKPKILTNNTIESAPAEEEQKKDSLLNELDDLL